MSEKQDRDLEAILKLIKLTQDGTLQWVTTTPWGDLKETETRKIESVAWADYEGKRLRIFLESIRRDQPSALESIFSRSITGERTYPYWARSTVLEITNQEGTSIWRFPTKSAALSDLMNAVRYQAAGVKELYDSLLKEGQPSAT